MNTHSNCISFDAYKDLWGHFLNVAKGREDLKSECLQAEGWQGKVIVANTDQEIANAHSLLNHNDHLDPFREFPKYILKLEKNIGTVGHHTYYQMPSFKGDSVNRVSQCNDLLRGSLLPGLHAELPEMGCTEDGKFTIYEPMEQNSNRTSPDASFWTWTNIGGVALGIAAVGSTCRALIHCSKMARSENPKKKLKHVKTISLYVLTAIVTGSLSYRIFNS